MKIRTLLAALAVAVAVSACGAAPTSPDAVRPRFDQDQTAETDTTSRTGKPMGSGN